MVIIIKKKTSQISNPIFILQIQGQINIAKAQYCYLIVYINDETPLFVEKIEKDLELWEWMLPILKDFYFEHMLPELAKKRLKSNF